MSPWGETRLLAALGTATLLFLLDLALSIVLAAVMALNRVTALRMSNGSDARRALLESLLDPHSTYRMAAMLMRQLCLMAGVLLVGVAVHAAGWSYPVGTGVAAGTLVGVLLFETVAAQLVALGAPKAALRGAVFLVVPARALLYPIVQPLHMLLSGVSRGQLASEEARDEEQEEEVEAYIEVGEREGILEANEGQMMRGIVDLDETRVREIMTPRTDIVALPLDTAVGQARRAVLEAGHSRLPVYRDTIDNVVGVLHERDLLRAWEEGSADQPITRYLREAMFVPEPLSAAQLLAEMRVKTHMALVVDEYGGVSGLVTLEDLLEEIVGDIREEHDEEEALLRQEPDGSWIIDAAAHVDELQERFGLEFDERDFDTVGGLVVSRLGRVPLEGETLQIEHLQFEVLKSDRRRIRQLRIRALSPPSEAHAGA